MNRLFSYCVAASCLIVCFSAVSTTLAATPQQAARGLLERVLPERADEFVLESIPPENGQDVFELESIDGKIVVRGSDGVSIASGINWYLKYYCHCHLSFNGDQLNLPEKLPAVPENVRRVSPFKYRYCFNFCAFSYTLAWWDWDQWQRMIDWMALHGINMPLSVTGQEAIWQKVYREMGLSDEQIAQFLVGPGYLPFGWMGCIDGWCGPLPQSWIDSHLQLQKKIVARQRELGMTPVLQGFTGHVPPGLKEKFPDAKFQRLPSWCQFPGTQFVDPQDPLFEKVGKAFIEEQTRQFGTDHLYASDTFIEMSPPTNDPKFLSTMGKAVYGAMAAGDPQAVWVMQGWLFVNNPSFWKPPQGKALLGAVPDERMIVLDLYCEAIPAWSKTEAFYGKPWVWCIIHNFGGQVGLFGGLHQFSADLEKAMTSPDRGDLQGIGLIMEGFGYNPIIWDRVTDMTFRSKVPPLKAWVGDFVHRRYAERVAEAEEAWQLLSDTAYRIPSNPGSLVFRRPSLGLGYGSAYAPDKMCKAWEKLLACAGRLGSLPTYQFDLVHVTRQILSDLAANTYTDVVDAYRAEDPEALAEASRRFLEVIRQQDELLGTREDFLLGKWLEDAKRWATNDEERRLYEWNARTIITLWGTRDSLLHEYAARQWSGLIGGFYLKRWEMFVVRLEKSLAEGKPFDGAAFERDIRAWEEKWTHGTETYPSTPQGDPVAVSQRLYQQYHGEYRKIFAADTVSLTTGKPTSCSSSLPPYPAHFAADGRTRNTNQYWATDFNQDKDPWWQVDLEEPTTVGRVVVILYYGDQRHYGFTVETSLDGKTWETVADQRDNKKLSTRSGHTCRFTPQKVRYLRVKVPHNSANTGRHLVEVLAYPQ